MFWLGLLIGIIIGCIITIIGMQKLLYYIGSHPEYMENLVSQITGQFTTAITREMLIDLNKKYNKIPGKYKEDNPFMEGSKVYTEI